jgi:hypothetical protein
LHPLRLSLAEVLMLTEHTVTTITVACDGTGTAALQAAGKLGA